MLNKKEKEIVIQCAKKYKASSVFLFGSSSVQKKGSIHDIDLGVKGIRPEVFFKFYGELFRYLSKPVDIVDLDEADRYLAGRIEEEGKIIYES